MSVLMFLLDIILSVPFIVAALIVLLIPALRMWHTFLKKQALEKLEYTRSFSADGIYKNGGTQLIETVRNPTWFPLFSVKFHFTVPHGLVIDGITCENDKELTSVCTIPPHAKLTKTHSVICVNRGHYQLTMVNLRYRQHTFEYDCPAELYVYPALKNRMTDINSAVCRAGETVSKRKYAEDRFFFTGIREYLPGDSMSRVNFKASAKAFSGGRRQLMCNSYDSSRSLHSMIFLNLTPDREQIKNAEESHELLEIGLQYAFIIFCETVRNGGNVGFSCNTALKNEHFFWAQCTSSTEHIKTILKAFSMVTYYQRFSSFPNLLNRKAAQTPPNTDVYIVTPYINNPIAKSIHRLKQSGRNVIPVLFSIGGKI